jgi:hypothetical protein
MYYYCFICGMHIVIIFIGHIYELNLKSQNQMKYP